MKHRFLTILVLIVCAAGCGQSDTRPAPVSTAQNVIDTETPDTTPSRGSDVIAFKDGFITIRGIELPFPMELDELVGVLGKPDRSINKNNINVIHVWDDCGLLAYCKPGKRQISSIDVEYTEQGYDFSPHQQYNGQIHINGSIITAQATPDTLRAVGLSQDAELPVLFVWENSHYSVIAEYTDSLDGVSIAVSQ